MRPQTLFLQPTVDPIPNPNPNFANAKGFAFFSNYSQKPSGTLTNSQIETLVEGGVATAMIQAEAVFNNDPTYSLLFSDSNGIGLDNSFKGSVKNVMKVVASFKVGAHQTFSFDFSADLGLKVKEIENSATEYNQANGKIAFLVLDTTNYHKPKVLDYFGIGGTLISSEQIAHLHYGSSSKVSINRRKKTTDIDGNNGEDSLTGKATGSYQKTFSRNTHITIVEFNASNITFSGDTLINNLGENVIYGTIEKDNIKGSNRGDEIYASLGNDKVDGKKGDDILEGGEGNDTLIGGKGDDKVYGGSGNDVLIGGEGNDILIGGDGYDKFVFNPGNNLSRSEFDVNSLLGSQLDINSVLNGEFNLNSLLGDKFDFIQDLQVGVDNVFNRDDSLLKREFDVIIEDFKVGVDKIEFEGWHDIDAHTWLNDGFYQGSITDTKDGLLFNFHDGETQGTLLLSGVNSKQFSSESLIFS